MKFFQEILENFLKFLILRNLCKPDKPLIIVWIMPLVMLGERSILGKCKVIDRQYSQDRAASSNPVS